MHLFPRGIVLPFQKGKAVERKIESLPMGSVRIPLSQTTEVPDSIRAAEDRQFAAGEVLLTDEGLPSLCTVGGHLTGTVVTNHPLYGEMLCAEITPVEGKKPLPEQTLTFSDEKSLTPDDILRIAHEAAIYDELDGCPLEEKLCRWQLPENDRNARNFVLVADATENDIFGSSSWAVLGESPRLAFLGLQMAARTVRFPDYHIAVMLPKVRRKALIRAIGRRYVYVVDDEYPVDHFAEAGKEAFCIGIQACLALGRAIRHGSKALAVTVTVAGDALEESHNYSVPFGTPVRDILKACGADPDADVVFGDAMTGIPCTDKNCPLLPGITTILVMKPRHTVLAQPCIGCGRCSHVCHAGLLPYEIVRRLENMHYERLQHLAADECDGCGACSYVCPSNRPVAAEVVRAGQTSGTMLLQWDDQNADI